jgi:hypothetical protein
MEQSNYGKIPLLSMVLLAECKIWGKNNRTEIGCSTSVALCVHQTYTQAHIHILCNGNSESKGDLHVRSW